MAQDPNVVAARWQAGLANATQKITDGVNAVTVAPGQAAARQKDVWANNTMAAKDKWAANTAAIPLQSWQSDMINKGVGRIAGGATAAQPKFAQFMGQVLPFIESAKQSLPPRGTFEQNLARSAAMITKMHGFKYQRPVS